MRPVRAVLIAAVLVAVGCSSSSGPSATTKPAATGKPIIVGVVALYEAYQQNEAKADQTYTGKLVELTDRNGKVEKVKAGVYTLGLSISDDGPTDVLCQMAAASNAKLAEWKDGQLFTLRGVCEGKKEKVSARDGFIIVVRDCQFVATAEPKGKK